MQHHRPHDMTRRRRRNPDKVELLKEKMYTLWIHDTYCNAKFLAYICKTNHINYNIMDNKIIIGELIQKEVDKQGLTKIDFAKKIHHQRDSVYKIFKKGSIDTYLLARISKALKRNFFQDLADSIDINEEYNPEDNPHHNNITRFLDSVTDALKELGRDSTILFPDNSDFEEFDVPDYILPEYMITFTVGFCMKERYGDSKLLTIETMEDENGLEIELMTNQMTKNTSINIKIDEKTEKEWYDVIKFAFEIYDKHNI